MKGSVVYRVDRKRGVRQGLPGPEAEVDDKLRKGVYRGHHLGFRDELGRFQEFPDVGPWV